MKTAPAKVYLTIVTEHQTSPNDAHALAETIIGELGENWYIAHIVKYHKFDDAFKIELESSIVDKSKDEINGWLIAESDKLASPWLSYYNRDENSLELIYNKTSSSHERRQEFSAIKWGHCQVSFT